MEQDYKLEQVSKVVVAGVVFGLVIRNAFKNGLVNELKDLKFSDMSDAMQIVPKIVNALKSNQSVAALEDAGADPVA